jgi:alginate O-acetyltransferase complex protein AlgI
MILDGLVAQGPPVSHEPAAMLFCSQQFLIFFLAVFALYWLTPWQQGRIYLLLVASFIFYATWNKWLAILIVASTTMDYLIARRLDASQRIPERKALLTLSIVFNLGVLCYFKYANFFLKSLEEALNAGGAQASFPLLSVILPIGISFYTFEAISYTVDVYRRKIAAERNLAHLMLFILFFPHLIAGPIVRGSDFLPQVRRKKRWNWQRMSIGVQLFLLGMIKKLAIADRMALVSDPVFAHPELFKSQVVWLAVFAYAVQIYCDFSGYSDMALGCAHLLGYRLAINFNMPYLATNIAEFWRRWHMSLSSWLRDYLFIPLGGSRGSRSRTCRNLLIVMTLGGLWHGASWNFVVWGLSLGVWLSLHRLFRGYAEARPGLNTALQTPAGTVLRTALTFIGVCCTWVLFRSPTLAHAGVMFHQMCIPLHGLGTPMSQSSTLTMMALVILGHWLGHNNRWRRLFEATPAALLGVALAVGMSLALVLAPDSGKAFIYFQF